MKRSALFPLALALGACSGGQATISGPPPRQVTVQSAAPALPAAPDSTAVPEPEATGPATTVPEAAGTDSSSLPAASEPLVEIPDNSVANGPLPGGGCWAVPAYVVDRESGCRNIPNDQGSGCDGYYQICAGTWDGYDGYPDAMSAPKEVQDAKAAELWANGNGCAHWAAC